MKDPSGTNQELLETISALKKRIEELERSEAEHLRAEEDARKSEERYHRLFDLESDAIFLIDSDTGRILETNNAASALYGYSKRELIGKKNTDISVEPQHTLEVAQKELNAVPLRYHMKKDGTVFPVEITVTHFTWNGRRLHLAAVRDITQRKEAEDALRKSEENYRNIHDNAMVGIFQSTPEGRYLRVNQALASMHGFSSPDDMINTVTNIGEQLYVDPEDRRRYMELLTKDDMIRGFETQLYRKDGSRFWISMNVRVVRHPDGSVACYEGIVEDITERKRAEEKLNESQRRLADIIEFLPDATLAIDQEGRVIAWNRAIEAMTGAMKEDMLGKGDYEYAIPFYGTRRPILINFVSMWDEEIEKQYSFIRKDGDTLFTETNVPFVRGQNRVLWGKASPLYDTRGNVVGAIESIRDITERRQIEKALIENQRRLMTLMSNLQGMAYRCRNDRDWTMEFVSDGCLNLTGYSPEDLIDSRVVSYAGLIAPDDRDMVWDMVQNSISGCTPFRMQYRIHTKDGRLKWVSEQGIAVMDSEGAVQALEGFITDITDLKQAEDGLRRMNAFLDSIVENIPDMIFLKDARELRFVRFNRAGEDLLGSSREDLMGKNDHDFFPKEQADFFTQKDREVLRGKEIVDIPEEPIQTRNKGERILHTKKVPILDAKGEPEYLLGISEDITERKRLEAQLMNAQKMEAIGTLSGGIAHDFNNILMGIQGYVSLMLLNIDTDNPHYEWLKQIEGLVKNAADLTRQLLGFARGGKYVVKPFNMNELIEKTSTMFGRTKKEIVIHRKYEKDMWAVEGDQGQIEQVFLNLYLNAWQAMPAGGDLSLETKNIVVDEVYARTHSMMPGRYVRTSISDTGVGMDAKTRERIFEPFFTTKELGRGTGLGLAMVYGIVKNHNGHIEVISEVLKGSTFVLYLPASEKDIAKEKPAVPKIMRGTETILLVDDEPGILAVSKVILESLGYSVYEAQNGGEAIRIYQEKKDMIDLVVLDMIMPGLSGSEVFDHIRELNPSVKVILSSGYSLNDQAQQIMSKGCQGFIQKPFDLTGISRKIREVLEK
ncbi:MAG TPA: PAS domain S-box protein [Syntrophorhabdaceae bacterium]|nr:PAS domain S-box protein [Syntrophorhabdaceae bacterium]